MTDDQARNVQQYEYDSFGNQHDMKNRIKQPYGYTGREHDRETGLRYYRARYYDGEVGVFLSKDPIGFGGGDVNFYAYVGMNPVNYIDPSGLAGLLTSRENLINGVPAAEIDQSSASDTCSDGEDFADCVEDCLKNNYGSSYDWAQSFSLLGLPSAAYELYSNETSRALRKAATSKLYTDTAYSAGKRQMKTLAQFSRFNNAMLVAGVGATTFHLTANGYCRVSCSIK